jgi:uncharacterized membrane protein YjjP (DUF1212 family)
MTQPTTAEHARLLRRLARALHTYGSPSHRIEEALNLVADALGIEAQFLVTPTSIVASVGEEGSALVFMERVEPGETDLGKLTLLNEVIRSLLTGELSDSRAIDEIQRIVEAPPRYGPALTVLAFTVASGGAAVLFGGRAHELLLSVALGALIGLLARLVAPSPRLTSVFPAMAAVLAAAAPRAALPYLEHQPFIPTLSALIVLIPGLTLTMAMNELAHRHLVSGTARLTATMVTFLQIGLGVAVGTKLATPLAQGLEGRVPLSPPWPWLMVALLLAAPAFLVLFRARPRDLPAILAATLIAFGLSRWVSSALGPELGAALGAFGVGVYSNLLARWRRKPSAITMLPGLLVLVPGSIGFRSVHSLIERDVLSGVEAGFAMVLTAVSLVTGLFLANLLRPRRQL